MPPLPDVAILCGGRGTRLQGILGDIPKPMAVIDGRPFLDFLIQGLARSGFSRVVLCTGYGKEAIRTWFTSTAQPVEIVFSEEPEPLGTAGALRLALPCLRSSHVLVLNGDSYTDIDLRQAAVPEPAAPAAIVSMVVTPNRGRDDAGTVVVGDHHRVDAFVEKQGSAHSRHLSAGIYRIPVELLSSIPAGRAVSLETEVLPEWVRDPGITAILHDGHTLDIGTPERLALAKQSLTRLISHSPASAQTHGL